MEPLKVTGMVLAASPIGEHDKRVVLLTLERGKIAAFARAARRQNSPLLAGTEAFAFGEFTLYEGRNSYTLIRAEISNYFRELAQDVEGACYGFYFLEVADYYGKEGTDEREMLRLLYQTLRALMHPGLPRPLIRRVYELKAMAVHGENPNMLSCTRCGSREELRGYSARQGGALCSRCMAGERDAVELLPSTVYAMQYILCTDVRSLYTFRVSDEVQRELGMVMDRHRERYMEKRFRTLDILQAMTENV